MKALLAGLSLPLALAGLLFAAAARHALAAVLLGLAAVCLAPVWVRGPRRIAVGSLAHLVVFCALIIGNLVCLHLLVSHRGWVWDLTRGARQTLSPITVQQVRALPRPVEMVAVTSDAAALQPTLERLAALTPRLRYRVLHPVRDIWELQRIVAELGVPLSDGAVIFRSTDAEGHPRRTVLQALERGELHFEEATWVNAMIRVTRESPPRVLFSVDHGERSLAQDLRQAVRILQGLSFDVDQGSVRRIPEGTDLVVIAGPTRDFAPDEIESLRAFTQSGGAVLVLLDPPATQRLGRASAAVPLTALEAWIEENGVALPQGVIAEDDPDVAATFGITDGRSPRVWRADSTHPISESIDPLRTPILMRGARPLEAGSAGGLEIETFLSTRPHHTWVTVDPLSTATPPANAPERRPITLGVAVTRPLGAGAGVSRLVVLADSDWLTDPMQVSEFREGNERLFRGVLGWLVQQEDLVAVPARTPPRTPITVTGAQLQLASALSVILLPEILLAFGVGLLLVRAQPRDQRVQVPGIAGLLAPGLALAGAAVLSAGLTLIGALLLFAGAVALLGLATLPVAPSGWRLAAQGTLVGGLALVVVLGGLLLAASAGEEIRVHPLTAETLAALERDVMVHAVASGDPGLRDLLARLSACSPRLRWEILDPRADASRIGELVLAFAAPLGEGEALVTGGDGGAAGPVTRSLLRGLDEQRWVNVVARNGRRRPPRLLFTEGHGEWSLTDDMPTFDAMLRQLALVPRQGPLTPESEADLIVIAGPTQDFSAAEIEMLDAHLERGGNLLVFLDPPTAASFRAQGDFPQVSEPAGLVAWLEARWGVSLPAAAVVDDDPQLESAGLGNLAPLVTTFSQFHPVTRGVWQQISQDQSPLLLTEARPVEIDAARAAPDRDAEVLFTTRESTWAETDLAALVSEMRLGLDTETRRAVPLAVAAARHRADRSARLVLVGDSDLLRDSRRIALSERAVIALLQGALGYLIPDAPRVSFADPTLRIALETNPARAALRSRLWVGVGLATLLALGGAGALVRRGGAAPRRAPLALATVLALALGLWLSRAPAAAPMSSASESRVSGLAPGEVDEVTIVAGEAETGLRRAGPGWQLTGASASPTAETAVELLLRMLEGRARHSVQPLTVQTDLAALGLDPPRARIALGVGEAGSETLLLGDTPPESLGQVWARVEGHDEVFTVDHDILAIATRAPERWRVAP